MARRIRASDADDWQGLFGELRDADDRAAGILAGEAVDVQLRLALESLCAPGIPKDVRERFLDTSSSYRSIVARALGIVSDDTYQSIAVIRGIHDAFVRNRRAPTFGSPEIAERAKVLPTPADRAILPQIRKDWPRLEPRYKYLFACTAAINAISEGASHRRVRPAARAHSAL
jgi:hypothetical protein